MTSNTYPPPVDQLLTFGDCQKLPEWPNYPELGLGPEQTPDLIRMAIDEELNHADSDSLEVWAPVHAWRALGQLHAEAAIEPLISLFRTIDEDDNEWAEGELPTVFGMIGPDSDLDGPFINAAAGVVTGTWDLDEGNEGATLQSELDNLLAENTYINIHTPRFPGGEVRGQIQRWS